MLNKKVTSDQTLTLKLLLSSYKNYAFIYIFVILKTKCKIEHNIMWDLIVLIWNTVVFEPAFNLLVGITALLPSHDFGLAILIWVVIFQLLFSHKR